MRCVDKEEITLTWSLLNVPETEDGDLDIAGTVIHLASQENVTPTDRILHTATIRRSVTRLDLIEAGKRGKLGLIKKYGVDDKGKVTIELHDAQDALVQIGKAQGLFVEKTDGGYAIVSTFVGLVLCLLISLAVSIAIGQYLRKHNGRP